MTVSCSRRILDFTVTIKGASFSRVDFRTFLKTTMAESSLKLGSRVSIIGKETLGLGTVRFVGETSFQTGIWVGIELEQAGMF